MTTKIEGSEPIFLRHLVAISTALIATGNFTHEAGEHSKCNGLNHDEDGNTLVIEAAEEIILDLNLIARCLADHDREQRGEEANN